MNFDPFALGDETRRKSIAQIITRIIRTQPSLIKGRVIPEQIPETLNNLKLLGLKKPFFDNAEKFISVNILARPEVFEMVAETIELSIDFPGGASFCWDGTGAIKNRSAMRGLANLGIIQSATDGVIMELRIQQIFQEIKPYLERPTGDVPWDA